MNLKYDRGDYVTHNIKSFTTYLSEFIGKPANYLEIGVFEGRSLFWLIDNIFTHPDCRFTGIDFDPQQTLFPNMEQHPRRSDITFYRQRSDVVLADEKLPEFDCIYVDGSHRLINVLTDGLLAWQLLKPSGIMIFDDYGWQKDKLPVSERPEKAIDIFLDVMKGRYELIFASYQIYIRKMEGTRIG